MNAFQKWLKRESGGEIEVAASILYTMLRNSPPRDSVVWDYMAQTGDKTWNADSFRKAARIALAESVDEGNYEEHA